MVLFLCCMLAVWIVSLWWVEDTHWHCWIRLGCCAGGSVVLSESFRRMRIKHVISWIFFCSLLCKIFCVYLRLFYNKIFMSWKWGVFLKYEKCLGNIILLKTFSDCDHNFVLNNILKRKMQQNYDLKVWAKTLQIHFYFLKKIFATLRIFSEKNISYFNRFDNPSTITA